ncbi:HypC/HybG/HupF family hydrogenase formation chaperone [Aneurinibacillus terranovensis]|uniref:HypC/HybG/HupF family hydrogenase formation chaperone n=1 Tax=Aneurinibacillus terranovensis TaxID=278991 RepID=UPI00040FF780|nr:HypC/HybG/HupF family hydrogenase formation chaperone [Aneurinibacillus terranovensis]
MCLAAPARVCARHEFSAEVDIMGNRITVGIMMTPEVAVGQYVLVHAGQAMEIMDEESARLSLEEWEKIIHAIDE